MLQWLSQFDFTGFVKELAEQVEEVAGKQIPIALAILAAVLTTILVIRAQRGGNPDAATAEKAKNRKFSAAEVAEHNKETDAWIILKGKVYDVTQYVEEHPGGTAILRNAGRDSTAGFYGPQHPERVFDLIDDFYIGDMAES